MIFADKVVQLRKKSGWSQEELAEKLNVTRQSVSKWEGAQSIPDLEKILQLAQIFGVSTDYLLKDELAEAEYTKSDDSVLGAPRLHGGGQRFSSGEAGYGRTHRLCQLFCASSPPSACSCWLPPARRACCPSVKIWPAARG